MPLGHFNAKESLSFLPTKHGFKLASVNITSLPKHIDELRVLLADRLMFYQLTRQGLITR
jgi:hypothetical protein